MQSKTYTHSSGYEVFEETYTSLSEYVNQIDGTLGQMHCDIFTDLSYEQVKDKALLGDDIDFKKIQIQIDKTKLSDSEVMLKTRKHDVIGSRPLTQQALNGSPNCYVRRKKQLVKQRIVNLYIDIGTSYKVKDRERTAKFTEILVLAKSLELSNYRVGITLFKNHIYNSDVKGRNISLYAITVKKPEEPINIKKLSFALGNSLFGRIFCFSNEILKHQGPKKLDDGLGYSYTTLSCKGHTFPDSKYITEIVYNFIEHTSARNTNALYVNYYTNLDELKKKISQ